MNKIKGKHSGRFPVEINKRSVQRRQLSAAISNYLLITFRSPLYIIFFKNKRVYFKHVHDKDVLRSIYDEQ
jgi:hypothetical protein